MVVLTIQNVVYFLYHISIYVILLNYLIRCLKIINVEEAARKTLLFQPKYTKFIYGFDRAVKGLPYIGPNPMVRVIS